MSTDDNTIAYGLSKQIQDIFLPTLSKEDSIKMAEKIIETKDEALIWEFVRRNTGLVYKILKNNFILHMNDDTFDAGLMGCHRAVKKLKKTDGMYDYMGQYIYYSILSSITFVNTQTSPSYKNGRKTIETPYSEEQYDDSGDYNYSKTPILDTSPLPFELMDLKDDCKDVSDHILDRVNKRRKITNRTREILLGLIKNGWNISQLARELNVSKQRIFNVKKEYFDVIVKIAKKDKMGVEP